jgi:hypothetical protein
MARRRQTQFELQREAADRKAEIARNRAARKRKGRERLAKAEATPIPKPRRRDPGKNFMSWSRPAWGYQERIVGNDAVLEEFVHTLSQVAPKVLTRENVRPIARLLKVQKYWLRSLNGWRPSGSSKHRQFRSLIEHLLCKYPTPVFLQNVFHMEIDTAPNESLYAHLARGGSVAQAIEKKLLPTVLTKKMTHNFMQSSANSDVVHAVRRAQIEAFGGDRRIVKAVCSTRLGRHFDRNEAFWLTVLQWVCNQPMMNPGQIGPIFDWVTHRRGQDQDFSMKGRNALSVLRDMEAWHNELHRIKKQAGGAVYPPSGFPEDVWEVQKRIAPDIWSSTEIGTAKELTTEGRVMKHCVWSYGAWIARGTTSIWSLRCNDERQLTLEVNNGSRQIVQARGHCNSRPTAVQLREMRRWATFAGLRIGTYV